MFGIGGGEILVVALVALLLFGNEDLPKNMRKMVKAWNDFRGVTNDLQRSWLDVRDQVTRDLMTDQQPPKHDPQTQDNLPAASESTATLPPPEGLHDGVFGQPLIQRATGSMPQDPSALVDEGEAVATISESPPNAIHEAQATSEQNQPDTTGPHQTIGKST
jgi:Sec-independent protein translocase protein TatA